MRFREIPQLTSVGSYQVNTPWAYLEETLARYNENRNLDLDPEFQRAHVWTEEKQAKYVEYILKGGNSSKIIYFNCRGWGKNYEEPMYLVDGKQRLEAVRKFMRNELTIFGKNYYKDFEDTLPWSAEFLFNVNNLNTYKEILQWYIDLNAGGVVHTEDEINKVKKLLEKEK
jgi:hypothetical protein